MGRRKQGSVNKKVDFLSDKLDKYSTKKFTVGTTSILIGATLVFESGQKGAEAAESDQTITNQGNTSSPTDTTD